MNRSRSFIVFSGDSKTIRWIVKNTTNQSVDASNISCKVYDSDMELQFTIVPTREARGVYNATIDTTATALAVGKYIIEFTCVANGQNKARRDFLYVKTII